MDFTASRFHRSGILLTGLALTLCTGILHANNTYLSLSAGATVANPITFTCNTVTGATTGALTLSLTNMTGVTLSATGTVKTIAVTVGSISVTVDGTTTPYAAGTGSPVKITPTAGTTFTTNAGTLAYTVALTTPAACAGLAANTPVTTAVITFQTLLTGGAATNETATPFVKVTQTAPVTIAPASFSVYCAYDGTTYTASSTSTVTVSTTSGSAVAISATSPVWLLMNGAVSPFTGSVTTAAPVSFPIVAVTPCASLKQGKNTTANLAVSSTTGSWTTTVPVTLNVVYKNPLVSTPTSLSLTYRKGGAAAAGSIKLTSPNGSYFTLDPSTLPSYLTVDSFSGTAPSVTGKTITFSTTGVADTKSPGTYTNGVHFKVSGSADLVVTVSLTVNNAAAVLTTAEGKTRSFIWNVTDAIPTQVITLFSSDTPIAYTVASTSGVVSGVGTNQSSGLAYNFGTAITVAFDAAQFQAATPGQTLSGTVTVTGGGTSITVTFNILVNPGSTTATLTAINPSSLPTAATNQVFTVYLYGSGFVSSTDTTQKTYVGVVSVGALAGGTLVAEPAITSTNVLNSSTIVLTITVPATADAYMKFATGSTAYIGVCNPGGTSCTSAGVAAVKALTIGSGPVISAVTSASSFNTTSPSFAPYDMISIFGANFCSAAGTGCGANVMYGTPDSTTHVYPSWLSPDSGARKLVVGFYTHGAATTTTPLATAPLLFATNGQINALVPGSLNVGTVDIYVSFGVTGSTVYSGVYVATIAATDPGIFTVGSDGQGDAASLATGTFTLINNTNPAIVRVSGSDMVQTYMTGLGTPTYVTTGASTCTTIAEYLGSLQGLSGSITTVDGAVMQSSLFTGTEVSSPCFITQTPMSFAAVASPSGNFAGWVTGAIAGLYQVNSTLPDNVFASPAVAAAQFTDSTGTVLTQITAPTQIPVWVGTPGSALSQTGVTMWVAPQLTWATAPSTCPASEATGVTTYTCTVVASGGSGAVPTYTYAASTLPAFLIRTLGAFTSTDPVGLEGSYLVTVTAKDGANPNTMSVTGALNLDIPNTATPGLALTGTNLSTSIYGMPNSTVTTVTATGGTGAGTYTYSVASTTPSTATITVDPITGVVSTTNATPAGTCHVVIGAHDTTATTALVGTLDFYLPVALQPASSNGVTLTATALTANTNLTTLSAGGATGVVTYTILSSPAWVTNTGGTGATLHLTGAAGQTSGTYSITVKASDAGTNSTGTLNLSLHIN